MRCELMSDKIKTKYMRKTISRDIRMLITSRFPFSFAELSTFLEKTFSRVEGSESNKVKVRQYKTK